MQRGRFFISRLISWTQKLTYRSPYNIYTSSNTYSCRTASKCIILNFRIDASKLKKKTIRAIMMMQAARTCNSSYNKTLARINKKTLNPKTYSCAVLHCILTGRCIDNDDFLFSSLIAILKLSIIYHKLGYFYLRFDLTGNLFQLINAFKLPYIYI